MAQGARRGSRKPEADRTRRLARGLLDDDASTHRAPERDAREVTAELDKRDFSDIPTAKLVELEMKTRAEFAREFAGPRIRSEQQLENAKADRTKIDSVEAAYTRMLHRGDTTLLFEPEKSRNGRKRSRHAD